MSLTPQKEYYYVVNNANRDLESCNWYRDGEFLANTGLATSYADSNIDFDTEYCYTVTAVYTEGESSSSNVDCATALDPGDVVELNVTDGSVDIGGSTTISVEMTNDDPVAGFQFTLSLSLIHI